MKKTVSKILLGALLVAPTLGFASQKAENLMTIITTDDSMTQLMAMVLSTQAKKQGANVNLLFCGKGADLVLKGAKEDNFKPKGMSPNKLLNGLIKSGAKVGVCPPYLPNVGKTTDDLIDGVKVVKPPKIAAKILDTNTKVLSY